MSTSTCEPAISKGPTAEAIAEELTADCEPRVAQLIPADIFRMIEAMEQATSLLGGEQ